MADETGAPPLPPGYERAPASLPPLPAGYERTQEPAPGVLESFGRGAAEGATFGFDDKLGLSKERREASRAANPWSHFLGEIAGGLAPMTLAYFLPTGVGQAAAVGRTAQLAGRGAGLLRSALVPGEITSTAQALGQGAKLGATYGALSGAGHANVTPEETLGEALAARLMGAVGGGAEGTVFGTGAGGLGRVVFRGAQGIGTMLSRAIDENAPGGRGAIVAATKRLERDRIAPQEIMGHITAGFPDTTAAAGGIGGRRFWGPIQPISARMPWTTEQVEEVVGLAMAGRNANQISSALPLINGRRPGPAAVQTLLDELANRHLGPLNIVDRASLIRTGSGENTQMGMRVAAATPGEATAAAREALLERQLGTNERIHSMLDRAVGSTDYDAVAAAHQAQMDAAADRLYDIARRTEQPFNLNPALDQWRTRFAGKSGTVPDAVNAAIDSFATPNANWQQSLAGALRRPQPGSATPPNAAPVGLNDFILARQGLTDKINREWIETPRGWELSQTGKTLSALKKDLSDVVRQSNPNWAIANDIFREGSAGNDALKAGARMSMRLNTATRDGFMELADIEAAETRAARTLTRAQNAGGANPTPGQQVAIDQAQAMLQAVQARRQLLRTGWVRAISDQLMNRGETEDLVRQMLFPGARQVIMRMLGNEQGTRFLNQLRAEAAMLRTYRAQFGSQTTPLAEALKEDNWAPRFEVSMANPMTWLNGILRLGQEHAARTINANRNTELMRLYTGTNPVEQLRYLRAMNALHRTRSNLGNTLGMPVVGSAAPISESTVAHQYAQPLPPSRRQQP